jgi:hypothetical protein
MAFSAYLTNYLSQHFFTSVAPITSPISTGAYFGLTSAQSTSYPYNWLDISNIGNGYTRQTFNYSIKPAPIDYVFQNSTITFPKATASWGNVRGLTLWDNDTVGAGNQLWSARWDTGPPNYTAIPYHTIDTGYQLTIPYDGPSDSSWVVIMVQGQILSNLYTVEYGGVAPAFNRIIMQWIFNLNPYPYARTYDVAIGRGATINTDNWGRWTGRWEECSGTNYPYYPNRISMATTDWVQTTSGVTNKNEIVFTTGAPDDTWGLIEDIVLYVTGTNTAAFWGHLAEPATISTGDAWGIGINKIKINWGGDVIT